MSETTSVAILATPRVPLSKRWNSVGSELKSRLEQKLPGGVVAAAGSLDGLPAVEFLVSSESAGDARYLVVEVKEGRRDRSFEWLPAEFRISDADRWRGPYWEQRGTKNSLAAGGAGTVVGFKVDELPEVWRERRATEPDYVYYAGLAYLEQELGHERFPVPARETWNAIITQIRNHSSSTKHTSSAESKALPDGQSVAQLLAEELNVIVEGPAGTGKTYLVTRLQEIAAYARIRTVVCHPALGYEDMVIGLRPDMANQGKDFRVHEGHILRLVREAISHPDQKFLLVLDEINRCNTASVLGDLLMVIENSKRIPAAELATRWQNAGNAIEPGMPAELPFEWEPVPGHPTQELLLPNNLHILGTMNTSDRSIAPLDLALRRRFAFHRSEPWQWSVAQPDPVEALLQKTSADDGLNEAALEDVGVFTWSEVNRIMREQVSPDAVLGDAYFLKLKQADFERSPQEMANSLWQHRLLPQLAELLVNFNNQELLAVEMAQGQIDEDNLMSVLYGNPSDYILELQGTGFGRYPMVVYLNSTDLDLYPPTDEGVGVIDEEPDEPA